MLIVLKLLATDIPSAQALSITSHATSSTSDPLLPPSHATESSLKRDDWMMEPPSAAPVVVNSHTDDSFMEDYGETESGRTLAGGVDFFSSLGTEHKKKEKEIVDLDKVGSYTFLTVKLIKKCL